jgi:hypothetical protein
MAPNAGALGIGSRDPESPAIGTPSCLRGRDFFVGRPYRVGPMAAPASLGVGVSWGPPGPRPSCAYALATLCRSPARGGAHRGGRSRGVGQEHGLPSPAGRHQVWPPSDGRRAGTGTAGARQRWRPRPHRPGLAGETSRGLPAGHGPLAMGPPSSSREQGQRPGWQTGDGGRKDELAVVARRAASRPPGAAEGAFTASRQGKKVPGGSYRLSTELSGASTACFERLPLPSSCSVLLRPGCRHPALASRGRLGRGGVAGPCSNRRGPRREMRADHRWRPPRARIAAEHEPAGFGTMVAKRGLLRFFRLEALLAAGRSSLGSFFFGPRLSPAPAPAPPGHIGCP